MNRKKVIIKIISIVLMVCMMFTICNTSFAGAVSSFKGTDMTGHDGGEKIVKIISVILAVVRTIGVGIAVIMLMIIGCKYMLASAGERAEIKKYAITYVTGAIILFASAGILSIIQNFVKGSIGIS